MIKLRKVLHTGFILLTVIHVLLTVALSRIRAQSGRAHLTYLPSQSLHFDWRHAQMQFVKQLMSNEVSTVRLCVAARSCVIHIIHSSVLLNTLASVFAGVGPQSSTVASVFWTWLSMLFSLLAPTSQGSLGLLIPARSKNTEYCVTHWD